MSNHDYMFDGKMYHQQLGGSLGLESTGNIGQVFMSRWDRVNRSWLSENGILVRLNKRYVVKINVTADEVPLGTRYKKGQLVVTEEIMDSGSLIPSDRTLKVIGKIWNSIHPSI